MGKEDRKQILDKAAACVLRDRNATHGEAEDNFKTIAGYWTLHLRARGLLAPGAEIAREDVAIMSAQIKLARLAQGFDHEDNWVDGAGYMACGGGCAADRRRAGQIYAPPVKLPDVGFDPARPGQDRSVATLTDGNGMPAVTAPSPRTLGAKVFTGEELDDLRNFILARPLPLGQTLRGAWTSGDAEMFEIHTLGVLGDLRFLLKRGKTFAEIEEELHACLGPKFVAEASRKVSLVPPANATHAEIQKFFEDVEAAGVRTRENNHLFYPQDREKAKAKERELTFQEGVLSPPPRPEGCGDPDCGVGGMGCAACRAASDWDEGRR